MTRLARRPLTTTLRFSAAAATLALLSGAAIANSPAAYAESPHTENVFYVLEARQGYLNRPIGAAIRQISYDDATNTVSPDNILLGGAEIPLPVKDGTTNLLRDNANALGVSPDGTFYFTTQLGSDSQVGTIDIWSVQLLEAPSAEHPNGVLSAPTRVAHNFMLNSTGGGNINGGAVNPRDGAFYFMYLSSFTSEKRATDAGIPDPSRYAEAVRAHLYRYDPNQVALGNSAVGEVAHIDFYKNSAVNLDLPQLLNGDITFDGNGNLILVTSVLHDATASGGAGPAMMVTVGYDRFGRLPNIDPDDTKDSRTVASLAPTATIGAAGQLATLNAYPGAAYNGLAFARNGKLIVEQGNTHTITNPVDFTALGPQQTAGIRSTDFTWVDLATAAGPPSLTVRVDVQTDRADEEQFTISGTQTYASGASNTFGPATTTGTARGIQAAQIGSQPVLADGTVALSLTSTAAPGSYTVTSECTAADGSGAAFAGGDGTELAFAMSAAPTAGMMGAQVTCTFTVRDFELAATGLSSAGVSIAAAGLLSVIAGGLLLGARAQIRRSLRV